MNSLAHNKVTITGINTNSLISLKSEQTRELLKLYQNGDLSKKEELVNGNLKLVLSSVNKFSKRYDNLDDLFQIGVVGLLKAIDHFDLTLDVMFSTYAVPMIEGEIRRYLRDNSFLRVSRQIKDLAYRGLKLKEQYQNEYGKSLDIDELAKMLEVTPYKIIESLEATTPISSLNEPLYNDFDDSLELTDVIANKVDNDKTFITYLSLHDGINALNKLEREIIYKRYYLGCSQIELASEYNISQAQVSRLEKNALKFLRKYVI